MCGDLRPSVSRVSLSLLRRELDCLIHHSINGYALAVFVMNVSRQQRAAVRCPAANLVRELPVVEVRYRLTHRIGGAIALSRSATGRDWTEERRPGPSQNRGRRRLIEIQSETIGALAEDYFARHPDDDGLLGAI